MGWVGAWCPPYSRDAPRDGKSMGLGGAEQHVLNTGLHLFVPQLLFTNTEVRHRHLIVSLHYTNCNTTRSFF